MADLGSSSRAVHFSVERAELREQLAHVLGAAAGRGLVGHAGHPLDQAGLVQRAHAHQHAADGAVAADPVLAALGQRVLDDRQVDRVEDDDRVVLHAQRGGGVDPVAVPAGRAQLGEDLARVVAALGGDDDVALLQRLDVEGVLQRGFVLRLGRGLAAGVGGGEEHRLDQGEVALGLHAVHQDRADHAAPADQADQRLLSVREFHFIALSKVI